MWLFLGRLITPMTDRVIANMPSDPLPLIPSRREGRNLHLIRMPLFFQLHRHPLTAHGTVLFHLVLLPSHPLAILLMQPDCPNPILGLRAKNGENSALTSRHNGIIGNRSNRSNLCTENSEEHTKSSKKPLYERGAWSVSVLLEREHHFRPTGSVMMI